MAARRRVQDMLGGLLWTGLGCASAETAAAVMEVGRCRREVTITRRRRKLKERGRGSLTA